MKLVDTHIHLTDIKYQKDMQNIVLEAKTAGIEALLSLSTSIGDSFLNQKLANDFSSIYFGVGVHPHDAEAFADEGVAELRSLLIDKKCVAVGEIGLDYYYEFSAKEKQKYVFRQMIELAKEYNKPISLHSRDSESESYEILKSENYFWGVCHSYTGNIEILQKFIDKGMFVSINGMLTFKKNENVVEILRRIPLDKLLFETDGPYLAPVPHRGKTNMPAYLMYVLDKASEVLGIDSESLSELTYNNARKLFGI